MDAYSRGFIDTIKAAGNPVVPAKPVAPAPAKPVGNNLMDYSQLQPAFGNSASNLVNDLISRGHTNLFNPPIGFLRTEADQRAIVNRGASKTMESGHRYGLAFDALSDKNGWTVSPKLQADLKELIATKYPELEYGGNWKKFPDPAHVQWRNATQTAKSWPAAYRDRVVARVKQYLDSTRQRMVAKK